MSAVEKINAMRKAGIKVAESPAEIGSTMLRALQDSSKKKSAKKKTAKPAVKKTKTTVKKVSKSASRKTKKAVKGTRKRK